MYDYTVVIIHDGSVYEHLKLTFGRMDGDWYFNTARMIERSIHQYNNC